jgi:hypothetical protein
MEPKQQHLDCNGDKGRDLSRTTLSQIQIYPGILNRVASASGLLSV